MKCAVIIVGAGHGARHGGEIPKQYQSIDGVPVFRKTLDTFLEHPDIEDVVAVIAKGAEPFFSVIASGLRVQSVIGGDNRTASVLAGMQALAKTPPDLVLIHDAARPLVSKGLISRLITAASKNNQAIAPGLPVADALKRVGVSGEVSEDMSREKLAQVQTPQVFPFKVLFSAYTNLSATADFADDLAVARSAGMACSLIEGEPDNFKITRPGDLQRAERIIQTKTQITFVSGSGFDVHRLISGDQMILCGVPIMGNLALQGHSDADAALHALTDAMLGTIGAGDIGSHFPPSDEQWKGVSSTVFLEHALVLLQKSEARLVHIDLTIICERPKITPHREAMRLRLASLTGLALSHISVKATTTEGLGFTGRGEGLAVMANITVALLN